MPLVPVVHEVMLAAFVNVPDDFTPLSQSVVQSCAEMSVARHVTLERFVQYSNIVM